MKILTYIETPMFLPLYFYNYVVGYFLFPIHVHVALVSSKIGTRERDQFKHRDRLFKSFPATNLQWHLTANVSLQIRTMKSVRANWPRVWFHYALRFRFLTKKENASVNSFPDFTSAAYPQHLKRICFTVYRFRFERRCSWPLWCLLFPWTWSLLSRSSDKL